MFRALRQTISPRKFAVLLALAAASGCSLEATDLSQPVNVVKWSGQPSQAVPTNTPLTAPLQVIVVNTFGQTLPDVTVNWTIVSGDGMLSAATSTTNDGGIASINYTTGPTAGTTAIQARVSGLSPVTFTVPVA